MGGFENSGKLGKKPTHKSIKFNFKYVEKIELGIMMWNIEIYSKNE